MVCLSKWRAWLDKHMRWRHSCTDGKRMESRRLKLCRHLQWRRRQKVATAVPLVAVLATARLRQRRARDPEVGRCQPFKWLSVWLVRVMCAY